MTSRQLEPPRPLRPGVEETSGQGPFLGAHVSVAGGMGRAFEHAAALGCTAMQVFVKNQQQWRGRQLNAEDLEAFQRARDLPLLRRSMAHASYLINLGSPDDLLLEKSIAAMRDEMQRCALLGIPALVVHPGAHMGTGELEGMRRVAAALRSLLEPEDTARVSILLECTAGQGTCVGHRFEHLARLIQDAGGVPRLGVCIDTCHLHGAGYDLRTASSYESVMRELENLVGLSRVRAFHLNDSKKPLGSRVDRHAAIGAGDLGRAPFGRLLCDGRFAGVPMVLETPGGMTGYRRNLQLLRRLRRGITARA